MSRWPMQPEDRFWSHAPDRPPWGCWLWRGATNGKGYGVVRWDGHQRSAHRVSWSIRTGSEVPRGLYVCHHCDVPNCVNPDHLFVGSPRDNTLDQIAKGRHTNREKLHCLRGHPFSVENTRVGKDGRYCRQCQRERQALERAARGCGPHHRAKTHCPAGHAYSGENLRITAGKRYCRECKRINERKRHAQT